MVTESVDDLEAAEVPLPVASVFVFLLIRVLTLRLELFVDAERGLPSPLGSDEAIGVLGETVPVEEIVLVEVVGMTGFAEAVETSGVVWTTTSLENVEMSEPVGMTGFFEAVETSGVV